MGPENRDVDARHISCFWGTPSMPSVLHEALLRLFRNKPTLAAELLANVLGADVPAYSSVRIESADLSQTVSTSYHADLVVLLLDHKSVLAIVVEVQLSRDPEKRASWPVYLAALRARLRCPVWLFVVTADDAIARWASKPIAVGHPGFVLIPFVLRPSAVPMVLDASVASNDPELAVLSAMAHGEGDPALAARVAIAAICAAGRLDEDRAKLYHDLVLSRLGLAARAALEELMNSGNYEYQSDFAKKYVAEGRAEGRAEAVLAVLAARGIPVPPAVRERFLACRDLAVLDRWLVLAVTATSAEDF